MYVCREPIVKKNLRHVWQRMEKYENCDLTKETKKKNWTKCIVVRTAHVKQLGNLFPTLLFTLIYIPFIFNVAYQFQFKDRNYLNMHLKLILMFSAFFVLLIYKYIIMASAIFFFFENGIREIAKHTIQHLHTYIILSTGSFNECETQLWVMSCSRRHSHDLRTHALSWNHF